MDAELALEGLLVALIEQARSSAVRMAGDPERDTPCHFCNSPVALWESMLVMQLCGVPAHVKCPDRVLDEKLKRVGPLSAFPYAEFSALVDKRIKENGKLFCSGEISAK